MGVTYLTTRFDEKDQVKALGARWDSQARSWYVPEGLDLAAFAAWLPSGPAQVPATTAAQAKSHELVDTAGALELAAPSGGELTAARKGMRLSQLLAGVAQAVAQAFKAGVWTLVEVMDARLRSGHVYVELSERGSDGTVLAKANAVIWASTAQRILPEFERATGAKLAPGIKLLVRARPVFKAQYGFSIEIDAIDPDYTLGDLEARKREIRTRLKQEGLFDANRQLPAPWDYQAVLVIAPQGAAGLGDFEREAERLQRHGACRFVYAHSRFQGEGAATEIRSALLDALDRWGGKGHGAPDAVAIIRGGGAVNDLAWLNDYDLARCICEVEVPVLTGIGHERDSTVLDEVAHQAYDTPSKVILGIEQTLRARVSEVARHFEAVIGTASRTTQTLAHSMKQLRGTTTAEAQRHLAQARQATAANLTEVRVGAVQSLQEAAARARESHAEVRHLALQELAMARQGLPVVLGTVLERSGQLTRAARDEVERGLGQVGEHARRVVADAATRSEGLVREITGQGPDKTLGRGFALVRQAGGQVLSSAEGAQGVGAIEIEFHDGRVPATLHATEQQTTNTRHEGEGS